MIRDAESTFDFEAAITSTRVSTNTYDLSSLLRDPGVNDGHLYLFGSVKTTFTAAGAATLACDLVTDDNAALASPTTIFSLMAATGKATLVAGYVMFKTPLPIGKIPATEKFIGLNWTVATGPMTAGAVSAFLSPNIDAMTYYPRGYVAY